MRDGLSDSKQVKAPATRGNVQPTEQFTVAQTKDAYCWEAIAQDEFGGSEFCVDQDAVPVRLSKIDGCLQKLMPDSIRERTLHAERHSQIAEQNCQRDVYDTIENVFFSLHMANDDCQTASNGAAFDRIFKRLKCKRPPQLFPSSKSFELFAMNELDSLPRAKKPFLS